MGGRSRAAAQLLSGQGFEAVYNLNGGIKAWHGAKAVGPAEVGMVLLRGDETPAEVAMLAYGLEEGLRGFYEAMKGRSDNAAVNDLLSRLAAVEVRHKERLFRLYLSMEKSPGDQAAFEQKATSGWMEGGFTTEEFLEANRPMLDHVSDVLGTAMMLETQALDLYMRYSRKSGDLESRTVFHGLADEEKDHLSMLGGLLEGSV
jgi:rubrerythrin